MQGWSGGAPTPVLTADEGGREWQVERLERFVERKEAAHDLPGASGHAASAVPHVLAEGVQPIVDGDLVACGDETPSEHLHTRTHGVRFAAVVEIAAGWKQNGAGLEIQLAEMALLLLRQRVWVITKTRQS